MVFYSSDPRILANGFRIGGEAGHKVAVGKKKVISRSWRLFNAQGHGIYCTPDASIARKYNGNGRSLIALRTISGVVSTKPLADEADWIGDEMYDSHYDAGYKTYVVRRVAQTLPCFLIHF
jgi:hypothetical protein